MRYVIVPLNQYDDDDDDDDDDVEPGARISVSLAGPRKLFRRARHLAISNSGKYDWILTYWSCSFAPTVVACNNTVSQFLAVTRR